MMTIKQHFKHRHTLAAMLIAFDCSPWPLARTLIRSLASTVLVSVSKTSELQLHSSTTKTDTQSVHRSQKRL